MTDNKFEFSHTVKFDEQSYVEVYRPTRGIRKPVRFAAACSLSLAMLLWAYTFLLGLFIISFIGLAWFMTRGKMSAIIAQHYQKNRFLRQKTVFSADERGLCITTKGYKARISWDKASVWRQTNDWLRIQTHGFPNGLFRVSELKQAGVYDQFVATLREHGVKRKQ
ncbi:MAG: hypothetical protein AAF299_03115 [Pseudomonadota bacterium]